jgi:hypothetical protein
LPRNESVIVLDAAVVTVQTSAKFFATAVDLTTYEVTRAPTAKRGTVVSPTS